MNVLVACEFSGVVRRAFNSLGHKAWSCDLLDSEDSTEFHIQSDCVPIIKHGWDLIIMHPPCTAVCLSGNRWYGKGKPKHSERIAAIEWTRSLFELAKKHSPRVAMENPVGVLGKPTQYVQPWQFGHGETKKTGLYLYGLAPLVAIDVVEGRDQRVWKMGPSPHRGKERSRTYPGIALAMAQQWGDN